MATDPTPSAPAPRMLSVAVGTAVVTGVLAVVGADALGLPLRDPDGFLGPAWVRMPLIVAVCLAVDVLPRAVVQAARLRSTAALPGAVRRTTVERWPLRRLVPVLVAVASFYVTYVGYRNLKNFLPFLHEQSDDPALAHVDRILTFGHNPADVVHDLLGTGVSAHVLSAVYMGFLVFVPISVVVSLVWSRHLSHGLWYVSALCVNWALGTASYYLVPSSGPFYVLPWDFATLAHTDAGHLQHSLVNARTTVLTDPHATSSVSGIAAFASLHVSITFTAALVIQLTSTRALFRRAGWVYLVLVGISTVYFGWHYLSDDLAGLAIGAVAVWLGAWATGNLQAVRSALALPGPGRERVSTG